jgi:hypothetical protein
MQGSAALLQSLTCMPRCIQMCGVGPQSQNNGLQNPLPDPCQYAFSRWEIAKVEMQCSAALLKCLPRMTRHPNVFVVGPQSQNNGLQNPLPDPCQYAFSRWEIAKVEMQGSAALLQSLTCMPRCIQMCGYGPQSLNSGLQNPSPEPCQKACSRWEIAKVEMQGSAALLKSLPCMRRCIQMCGNGPQSLNNGLHNPRPEPCQ